MSATVENDNWARLSELVTQFTIFASQAIAGLAIFAIGLYLANLAATCSCSQSPSRGRNRKGLLRAANSVVTASPVALFIVTV